MYQKGLKINQMALHYNIYNQQQQRKNFGRNHMFYPKYIDHQYEKSQQKQANFTFNQEEQIYSIPFLPNQLILAVFEQGKGNNPNPGQFITLQQKIYFQGERNIISDQKNYIFGRNRNPLPLQLVFSMVKPRMKARVTIGPEMAVHLISGQNKNKNKTLIYEINVLQISVFPSTSQNLLDILYIQLLNYSIEGDKAFENNKTQKALICYHNALSRMFDFRFEQMIQQYKQKLQQNLSGKRQQQNDIIWPGYWQNKKKKQIILSEQDRKKHLNQLQKIRMIEQICSKISVKGIQLAYIVKQYFKAIKWSHLFLKNPKNTKNLRVMMVRANCYLQLQQNKYALQQFKLIKLIYPHISQIDQKIQSLKRYQQQNQLTKYQELQKKKQETANMNYLNIVNQQSDHAKKIKYMHQILDFKTVKEKQIDKKKK